MNLEVLVATVDQKDFSLVEKMNMESNAVIANQNGTFDYEKYKAKGGIVKMISTNTRGIGVNRNVALMFSDADILLFSDDDVRYVEGYASEVIKAFQKNPKADAIVFGIDLTRNGKVVSELRNRNSRVHFWNSLHYGACVLAIRRSTVQKYRLVFSTLFGGKSEYLGGEDSLFILDLLRKGGKIYASDYVLGTSATDKSSWFSGYHEKYFYDKGAWLGAAFPRGKHIVKWYFIFHDLKMTKLSMREIHNNINAGIKGYKEKYEINYSDHTERA